MFRTVPLSIIRSFLLYTQQWYVSYRFTDICQLFEKIVHLAYSIIRIYHDARSPERQDLFSSHTINQQMHICRHAQPATCFGHSCDYHHVVLLQ